MSFELGFLDEALKEWCNLDNGTREQLKKKLAERLESLRSDWKAPALHQLNFPATTIVTR
jgi:mRNA-degrading endonuclease RelE of RelBE toxin-antitoxin system